MPVQYIVVVNGPEAGRKLIVNREFSIGRGSDNDLCIPDNSVSRHHTLIRNEDDRAVIHDLGAANGVVVNGQRIDKFRLRSGVVAGNRD